MILIDIAIEIGRTRCLALPALHGSFTGNDYTSGFHGMSNVTTFKLMNVCDVFEHFYQIPEFLHIQRNLVFSN